MIVPTERFITIMTPKWIGLIPKLCTIGRKIGVKIKSAGAISINVPTIRRKILRISRITYLLLEIPRTSLLIAAGSPVKDITNDNTEDAPMISITIVVITAASTSSFGISLSLIVL